MIPKLQIVACINMYILHIETSTRICSVALSKNGNKVHGLDLTEGMNHTAMLAPSIEELLSSCSIHPKDLGAISVSSGPGSYTGLRVGSSTAKAMAYSLGIPIIAVPTLMALARAIFDKHEDAAYALPMIDARRKEVYTALYDRSMREIWPVSSVILNEEFFSGRLGTIQGMIYSGGDGALKMGEEAALALNLKVDAGLECSASHLIGLAEDLYKRGEVEDPLHFVPYYMKPPNITQPKNAGFDLA